MLRTNMNQQPNNTHEINSITWTYPIGHITVTLGKWQHLVRLLFREEIHHRPPRSRWKDSLLTKERHSEKEVFHQILRLPGGGSLVLFAHCTIQVLPVILQKGEILGNTWENFVGWAPTTNNSLEHSNEDLVEMVEGDRMTFPFPKHTCIDIYIRVVNIKFVDEEISNGLPMDGRIPQDEVNPELWPLELHVKNISSKGPLVDGVATPNKQRKPSLYHKGHESKRQYTESEGKQVHNPNTENQPNSSLDNLLGQKVNKEMYQDHQELELAIPPPDWLSGQEVHRTKAKEPLTPMTSINQPKTVYVKEGTVKWDFG